MTRVASGQKPELKTKENNFKLANNTIQPKKDAEMYFGSVKCRMIGNAVNVILLSFDFFLFNISLNLPNGLKN